MLIVRWVRWCKAHKDVKCVEYEVPLGILPFKCKGVLIDVKVSSRGPDDRTYAANKSLRDKVRVALNPMKFS
jgi:hypothetical protein